MLRVWMMNLFKRSRKHNPRKGTKTGIVRPGMEGNSHLVGGLRMELRLRFNHYLDTVNHALENHLFKPASFNVRTSYKTIKSKLVKKQTKAKIMVE
jgi:hypothetical protein